MNQLYASILPGNSINASGGSASGGEAAGGGEAAAGGESSSGEVVPPASGEAGGSGRRLFLGAELGGF